MSALREIIPGVTPTGAIPDYVPPHLQGKVWDFQNEADGNVSFQHPEAALGLGPDQSRVTLTPQQYESTFDDAGRSLNFRGSMKDQYAPLSRSPETPGMQMNSMIADKLRGAYNWGTSSQGKAVGTAALLSALAGGAGSYLFNRGTGNGSIGKYLLWALLAGGAGAGATAWGQGKHNRREAYLSKKASPEVDQAIIRLLSGDPTLSNFDRADILRALARVDTSERDKLYRLMRTSIGAGAGMLAMRFLGAKGLMPMAAGGILGAMLGSAGGGLSRNRQGQVNITNYY